MMNSENILCNINVNEVSQKNSIEFNTQDVPIIIAGNKEDMGDTKREVYVEDVVDWVQQDYKLNR